MTHYLALVHKDADSAYGITFPDLPGCFSAADGQQDIPSNGTEAVALWAEDVTLPAPSTIEELRSRADVMNEPHERAFLIAVPASMATEAA